MLIWDAQAGPWTDIDTKHMAGALSLAEIRNILGVDSLPDVVLFYVKLAASIISGSNTFSLYQIIKAENPDATRADGRLLFLGSATEGEQYGPIPIHTQSDSHPEGIDPNGGPIVLFVGGVIGGAGTITVAAEGQAPVSMGGLKIKSTQDAVTESMSNAASSAIKEHAGEVASNAIWGFLLLVFVLLIIYSIGPKLATSAGKAAAGFTPSLPSPGGA